MPFRRHTSLLAMLLCTLMVLAASMQTLHEQLAHDGIATHCEYCLQALDASGVIPPLLIVIGLRCAATPDAYVAGACAAVCRCLTTHTFNTILFYLYFRRSTHA